MRLVPVIGIPMGGTLVSLGGNEYGVRRRPRNRRRDVRRAVRKPQRDQRRDVAKTIVRAAVENQDLLEELPIVDAEYTDPEELEDDYELGAAGSRAAYRVKSPPAKMGRFILQAPAGIRAAVVELKPGLYVVAEVHEHEVAGFGGPINMSRRILNATKAALENPNKPKTDHQPRRPRRRARWEDEDTNEYGCAGCNGRCPMKE